MPQKLTKEIITAAIVGFEAQKQHIDSQIAELRNMVNSQPATLSVTVGAPPKPKRKISAASRLRMEQA